MKDQHEKIKGYRDLSQQEIDLMNRIKEHGEKTKKLLSEMFELRQKQQHDACENIGNELSFQQSVESIRCLGVAKEHLQTGQMWFVRAVALPDSF